MFICLSLGVRPFPCPHCEKFFRTSGHRKTHVTSHFKSIHNKKHKYPRKPHKTRVSRSNLPLPDIPLQEPILITDMGTEDHQQVFPCTFTVQLYLSLQFRTYYIIIFSLNQGQKLTKLRGKMPWKVTKMPKGKKRKGRNLSVLSNLWHTVFLYSVLSFQVQFV